MIHLLISQENMQADVIACCLL